MVSGPGARAADAPVRDLVKGPDAGHGWTDRQPSRAPVFAERGLDVRQGELGRADEEAWRFPGNSPHREWHRFILFARETCGRGAVLQSASRPILGTDAAPGLRIDR